MFLFYFSSILLPLAARPSAAWAAAAPVCMLPLYLLVLHSASVLDASIPLLGARCVVLSGVAPALSLIVADSLLSRGAASCEICVPLPSSGFALGSDAAMRLGTACAGRSPKCEARGEQLGRLSYMRKALVATMRGSAKCMSSLRHGKRAA